MNILLRILCGILAVHMYVLPGFVKDIDYDAPMIECEDYATGNRWCSKDVEKWGKNGEKYDFDDDVLLIMWDNGTEDMLDDVIVKICQDFGTIFMENFYVKGRN